ncbi:MAG TPA: mandelate racemase/muconate lactonizing enzyme family protein, partial [Thermodesulfobacteriota bacterium]|nr:mandelate racemase/muconate lactonizing enzyme family protein [Thermodesulfobacteriota bacterium]
MKIKDVRAYTISSPLEKPWRIAGITMSEMTATLVEVEADNGLIGFGEALTRLGPSAAREVITAILKPVVVGADPMNVDVLWERMFSTMKSRGHWKGFMIEAMSGVDIALWDLNGKALNLPVSTLLGGRHREELPAYASSIMLMEEKEMVKEAVDLVKKGFRKIKVKLGLGVETDFGNIRAIRREVGDDIGIMLDANCGYSPEEALRLGAQLEPLNILWLEEPVPPYDLDGYAKLSESLRIPIAGGESEFTRWGFRDLILKGKATVIQPDIARCGGFTEARKIAALAAAHGVPVAPHTGASGAVSVAAAVHLSASLSNFYIYEHMYTENPLRTEILKAAVLETDKGVVKVPKGPGLGIE